MSPLKDAAYVNREVALASLVRPARGPREKHGRHS